MSGLSESSLIPINKHSSFIFSPGTELHWPMLPRFIELVSHSMWITAAGTELRYVISTFHGNVYRSDQNQTLKKEIMENQICF